jgi:hypothetical protein
MKGPFDGIHMCTKSDKRFPGNLQHSSRIMKTKTPSIRAAIFLLALPLCDANAAVVFFDDFESPAVSDFNASVFSSGWTLNESNANQLGLRNGTLPHDGSQVAQINANNSAPGASFSRSISTVIGQTYTLSLWYLSYVSTSAVVRMDFGLTSASSPVTPAANTWYELTFDHTATATSTLLSITDLTTNTVSSDLFVDTIRVTTIPEPSAAGLLALGASAALLRKNRRH